MSLSRTHLFLEVFFSKTSPIIQVVSFTDYVHDPEAIILIAQHERVGTKADGVG